MTNHKTVIISTDVPSDGEVLTYSTPDGYFKPLPPAVGAVISSDVSSSPYNVAGYGIGQRFRMLVAGTCTVNLPADTNLVDGSQWSFKDVNGNAGTYTYTVSAGSNTTIDGSASFVFPAAYTCLTLYYNATSKNWEIS